MTFIVTVTWTSPGAPLWLPVITDHFSDDPTDSCLLLQLLEPHLGHLCNYLSSLTTSQTILQIHVYCYSYLNLTWGTFVTSCHHQPPLRRSYRFTFIVTVTWTSPGAPLWLPVITDHLSDDPTDSRLLLQLLEPHLGHLCDYLSSPTTSQTILQIHVYCYSYLNLTWDTCATSCHHQPPLRQSYRFTFIVTVTWTSPGAPVRLPVITDHLSDDPTDSRLLLQLLEPHLGHLWRLPVITDHLSDDPTDSRLLLQLLEPHLGHLCDYLSSPTTSQTILQIHVYCYSYLSLTWDTCATTCHHWPPLRQSYRFTFIVTVTWASPGTPLWLPVITDHLSDDPTDVRRHGADQSARLRTSPQQTEAFLWTNPGQSHPRCEDYRSCRQNQQGKLCLTGSTVNCHVARPCWDATAKVVISLTLSIKLSAFVAKRDSRYRSKWLVRIVWRCSYCTETLWPLDTGSHPILDSWSSFPVSVYMWTHREDNPLTKAHPCQYQSLVTRHFLDVHLISDSTHSVCYFCGLFRQGHNITL